MSKSFDKRKFNLDDKQMIVDFVANFIVNQKEPCEDDFGSVLSNGDKRCSLGCLLTRIEIEEAYNLEASEIFLRRACKRREATEEDFEFISRLIQCHDAARAAHIQLIKNDHRATIFGGRDGMERKKDENFIDYFSFFMRKLCKDFKLKIPECIYERKNEVNDNEEHPTING